MSNLGIFLTVFFDHCATYLHSENTVRSITKLDQIEHFGLSKKAAVISNFCLIGKINHNFLVLRMIELAWKTFMPIQTLDLHRVILLEVIALNGSFDNSNLISKGTYLHSSRILSTLGKSICFYDRNSCNL